MEPAQRSGACPRLTPSKGGLPRHMRSGQARGTPPSPAGREDLPDPAKGGPYRADPQTHRVFPARARRCHHDPFRPHNGGSAPGPAAAKRPQGRAGRMQGVLTPGWPVVARAAHSRPYRKPRERTARAALAPPRCTTPGDMIAGEGSGTRRPNPSPPRRDTATQAGSRDGSLPSAVGTDRNCKAHQVSPMKTAPASTLTGKVLRLTQTGNRFASPVR